MERRNQIIIPKNDAADDEADDDADDDDSDDNADNKPSLVPDLLHLVYTEASLAERKKRVEGGLKRWRHYIRH